VQDLSKNQVFEISKLEDHRVSLSVRFTERDDNIQFIGSKEKNPS